MARGAGGKMTGVAGTWGRIFRRQPERRGGAGRLSSHLDDRLPPRFQRGRPGPGAFRHRAPGVGPGTREGHARKTREGAVGFYISGAADVSDS